MQLLIYVASFGVIALAAHRIGHYFSRLRLPYIVGYLFAGALVGPFGLGLIPAAATEELRFIDQLALAIIAFVAGSELYLKELRSRLKVIVWSTFGILVVTLLLLGGVIFWLTTLIPFTQDMPMASRFAVAVLGSTVLLALSPPSTIAVIKELRARGVFTRTILSVTVFMDVVIIVLFAISASLAGALLNGAGVSPAALLVLVVDLALAVLLGYGTGRLLQLIMNLHRYRLVTIGLIFLVGYGIFWLNGQIGAVSAALLPVTLKIEPLLVALIGGFYVTNFSRHRDAFAALLHDVGPLVYVAFFTLTGISLKLDVLLATWPIALALFGTRIISIFIGSFAGSSLAGEPARFNRIAWMAFITQAGIALGLARTVAVDFPALGDAFATMIISVIVLNEIFGPLFLGAALRRAGEVHVPDAVEAGGVRDVVILGVEGQSLALARQLTAQGWQVTMADTDHSCAERLAATEMKGYVIPEISAESLNGLITKTTNAVVAMLNDDAANLRACEAAYERFGVPRLIVRLNNLALAEQFTALGAIVVDPTSAMVNLLDQSVRAPQSVSLLLHTNPDYDIVQISVSNPDVAGMLVRDLRLPNEVLLLDVWRNGHSIVPNGYTRLQFKDEVTLIGRPDRLTEVALRLEQ